MATGVTPRRKIVGMSAFDKLIAAAASRRLGLFTTDDAEQLGLTDQLIHRRVGDRRLQSPQRGVFLAGAVPATWDQRMLAACLYAGDCAVASHRAAAFIHGFDGAYQGPLELTMLLGQARPRGVLIHRTDTLDAVDRTVVRGVPTTSVVRSLIDYGAVVGPGLVERAVESALRNKQTTEPAIHKRLLEIGGRGRRGVAKLRSVLALRPDGGPAGSQLEILAAHLDAAEEGGLVRQYRVVLQHGEAVLLDWAFPDVRYNVEFDSELNHGGRRDAARDIERDKDLGRLGWTVRRFWYHDVAKRPAWVSAEIRADLRRLRA